MGDRVRLSCNLPDHHLHQMEGPAVSCRSAILYCFAVDFLEEGRHNRNIQIQK